jgi:DNA replication protein DnaC
MGYNKENFKRIREEYDTKALLAQRAADGRREEVHARIPELRELDGQLSSFGLRLLKQAMEGGETAAAVEKLQEENRRILERRRTLLLQNGYPEDYCKPRYECEKCNDSGYVDLKMCVCMRKKLIEAGMEASGLGGLLKKQSFENFSLDYYRRDAKQYELMKPERLHVVVVNHVDAEVEQVLAIAFRRCDERTDVQFQLVQHLFVYDAVAVYQMLEQ